MLILTRRIGEKILINGKEIDFTIMNIKGCQVRFGINAPKDVRVDRQEIRDKVDAERKAALQHDYEGRN